MKPDQTKTAPKRLPPAIGINLAIVFFNAILIAAVWISALEVAHIDREETINTAIDRNDNLAIAFEEYTKRTIESADSALQYLIREYQRKGKDFDIDQFVADHSISSKAFQGVALADETGRVASAADQTKPVKPVNVADREHFKVHQSQDSGRLFVGKPIIARINGKEVIPITRRFNKPDGSFSGVAIVLIEPSRFTDLLLQAKLKNLDIITLIGTDGILRARLKGTTTTSGEDVSKSPVFKEYVSRPNGHYFAKGQIDGIAKFFSYRTLPDYQLIAVVAAAESDVLSGFSLRQRNYFWAAAITSALIAGFTLLLILTLLRQRRADAAVTRSQARLSATFNQIGVGIGHADLDGRCLDANQKLCEITGYTREELLGRNFNDITHPDDIAAGIAFRRQVVTDPDIVNRLQREKRYIRKDGSIVWVQLTNSIVRDNAGNIAHLAAVIEDISQRRAAEQAIKALEQEQRQLAEAAEAERARLAEAQAVAKIGSWETRFPDLTVIWSAETYRIFETDTDRFQPTHPGFLAFVHPDDRAMLDAAFANSLTDRLPHSIEHRIVVADGRIKVVEERWRVFFDDQGQPVRAAGTCQDITDKKQAEQERAQLAAIVESSNDAIISRDLNRTILSWNPAAERLFGWTAAEALGQSVSIITPPDRAGELPPVVKRLLEGKTIAPVEAWRLRKDGSQFEAQISFSAIRDSEGKITAIATIIRDITERREKEALALKEKMFSDAMIESMPGIVYFYNEQGRFLRWNENFVRVSGYTSEEIAQMHPLDFFDGEEKGLLELRIREVFEKGESSVEASFLLKNGSAIPYFFTGRRVLFDGAVCLVGMGIDIHERKLAEAALRDFAAQMRHLSWRLSEVEERERRDIHRELHDQIGANLSALKLDLNLIGTALPEDVRQKVGGRLQQAQQLAGEIISRIRDVMADLRPPALDDFGLLAALRACAQPYALRLGIPVTVDGDDIQPRPAVSVETALFRIAQEALNNIAKHAQAHHVGITLETVPGRITLIVADDGVGFDDRQKPQRSSWGLRTMRERAQAIAAGFRVESSPGNGTRVIVELSRESA